MPYFNVVTFNARHLERSFQLAEGKNPDPKVLKSANKLVKVAEKVWGRIIMPLGTDFTLGAVMILFIGGVFIMGESIPLNKAVIFFKSIVTAVITFQVIYNVLWLESLTRATGTNLLSNLVMWLENLVSPIPKLGGIGYNSKDGFTSAHFWGGLAGAIAVMITLAELRVSEEAAVVGSVIGFILGAILVVLIHRYWRRNFKARIQYLAYGMTCLSKHLRSLNGYGCADSVSNPSRGRLRLQWKALKAIRWAARLQAAFDHTRGEGSYPPITPTILLPEHYPQVPMHVWQSWKDYENDRSKNTASWENQSTGVLQLIGLQLCTIWCLAPYMADLARAELADFRGNIEEAKQTYLSVLLGFQDRNITDKPIDVADVGGKSWWPTETPPNIFQVIGLRNAITGEPISIAAIEARLKQMGWTPPPVASSENVHAPVPAT